MLDQVGAEAENYIWTGNAATSGEFGGFNRTLITETASIPAGQKINAGTPSSVDSTNPGVTITFSPVVC